MIFDENLNQEDKTTVFKRYIGVEVSTEPDVNSVDYEMDHLFNRTK